MNSTLRLGQRSRHHARRIGGHRNGDDDLDTIACPHAAHQALFAVAGECIEHGQLVATDPPDGAENQRAGQVAALDKRRRRVSRRETEAPTDDVVKNREQARRGIDSRPAQPGDVAVGVDEGCGAPVGEQGMVADGMLHGAAV